MKYLGSFYHVTAEVQRILSRLKTLESRRTIVSKQVTVAFESPTAKTYWVILRPLIIHIQPLLGWLRWLLLMVDRVRFLIDQSSAASAHRQASTNSCRLILLVHFLVAGRAGL